MLEKYPKKIIAVSLPFIAVSLPFIAVSKNAFWGSKVNYCHMTRLHAKKQLAG